jgi:DNA-binding transcriptional LysR family regulator
LRRDGRAVTVTPEGRLLLQLAQPPVGLLDSLPQLFAARRQELPQQLSLVSTPYLFTYHLAEPIRKFVAQHPSIRLDLRTGSAGLDLARLVERGDADMGVVIHDPEEARPPNLDYEDLFQVHLTLVTPEDHPLARKKKPRPIDVVDWPVIVGPAKSYAFRTLERWLRRHDLFGRLHVVLESTNVDIVRTYVQAGVGIAILYLAPAARAFLGGLSGRLLEDVRPLPIALVTRRNVYRPEAVDALRAALRQHLVG